MQNSLSEEDLLKIFSYKERAKHRQFLLFDIFYKITVFVAIACASYLIINFSAFATKIKFWYQSDIKTASVSDSYTNPATPDVPDLQNEVENMPALDNNHIGIPELDINAPINFNVKNNPKDVSNSLENGIIQIDGTAMPGEKGNIYMTGHSSNYIWAKGNYNSIFALLDKLVVGDSIYVRYNEVTYKYKVFDKKVVLATDTSVMQTSNDSRLTLVTCWPVGTSLKRLAVLANQVTPDPTTNVTSKSSASFNKLPSGR